MHSVFLRHAWRALRRERIYAAVSVAGLSIGLAVVLLVSLWAFNEYTFDRFHKNGDRIYRVIKSDRSPSGHVDTRAMTGVPLADALEDECPGIEETVRVFRLNGVVRSDKLQLPEQTVYFADPSLFDVFTFPLIQGDRISALSNPNAVVLSRHTAERLFGSDSPIGQTILFNNQYQLEVTGVLAEIPQNSHLQFDYLVSYTTLFTIYPSLATYWDAPGWTYFLLSSGAKPDQISQALPRLVEKYRGPEAAANVTLGIQPLYDIHLGSFFGGEIEPKTEPHTLTIFLTAALLILLLAVLNHNNLATARAAARVRELAVRRVLGSNRLQMFLQWTYESVLIVALSAVLALMIAEMIQPDFARIVGVTMPGDLAGDGSAWIALICLALLTIAITSVYPAHYALTFKTVALLRFDRSMSTVRSFMRRSLVIVQFTIGIALVLCAAIAYQQVTYLQNQDLGFNPDNIAVVHLPEGQTPGRYAALNDAISQVRGVSSVTAASHIPGGYDCYGMLFEEPSSAEQALLQFFDIDQSFAECLELSYVDIDSSLLKSSQDAQKSCLISESAAAKFATPPVVGSLLGTFISQGGKREKAGDIRVAGIVRDFHARNLFYRQHPIVLIINPNNVRYLLLRINSRETGDVMAAVSEAWSRVEPDQPLVHSFLRDELSSMYSEQERFAGLLSYASLVAIVLACVGLLSLGSFMLARRTREIGVRKALGATTAMVARLLSKEMFWLVVISNLVAWPFAYWFMTRWLENYIYRTTAHPAVFLVIGLSSVIVALGVVSYHTIRAASRNPVDALRYE